MLSLSCWPYMRSVILSGDIKTDITNLLAADDKQKTATHCLTVANTSVKLAERFGLDTTVASISASLHDISAIMQPSDMLCYATNHSWEIDASEERFPFILHQRLSAVFAKELFGVNDPLILAAIECHSTLKADPSDYDMVLFLADKLSWDQEGTPPFFDAVSSALDISLACASLVYINFVLNNGMILFPHQWLMDAKNWLENNSSFPSFLY